MKKFLLTVLAGALLGAAFVPVLAADDSDKFTFNGEVRARYEYLNNYWDLTDSQTSGDGFDDGVSLAPYRVKIGMTGNFTNNVTGHIDLQYNGLFGDRFEPQWDFFAPPGQFDTPYFSPTVGVQLYTGWIEMAKIGGTDLGFRLGRQEHTYGTELFMGDNDYYAGLSFDGLRGMWQHGNNDLNFFYYKTAEANYYTGGSNGGANDSDLFGATYDWNFNNAFGTVGGYVLIGQDLDGFGPVFYPDSKVITYGARWTGGMMNGDKLNMFDWTLELAAQSGDAGEPYGGPSVDLAGWIGEGWFGYNFKTGDSHGRVHVGFLVTSGDDSSTTDKYEGFIPLYGDFQEYNRFGDLDWVDFAQDGFSAPGANIADLNIGYEHWFGQRHYVMAAWHTFSMTESNQATYPLFFDPSNPPSDKLGDEIDLSYGFTYSKNLGFLFTVGQANPGDAARAFAAYYQDTSLEAVPGDSIQRITLQAKLHW